MTVQTDYVALCHTSIAGVAYTPGEIVDQLPADKIPDLIARKVIRAVPRFPVPDAGESTDDDPNAVNPDATNAATQEDTKGSTQAGAKVDTQEDPKGSRGRPESPLADSDDADDEELPLGEQPAAPVIDVSSGLTGEASTEAQPAEAKPSKGGRKK